MEHRLQPVMSHRLKPVLHRTRRRDIRNARIRQLLQSARIDAHFARAVAELGVDRGIDAFQRYAFIERNGQANLATPLGVFYVQERPLATLVQQVERWLDAFTRATSDEKKAPPRFVRARKQIEEAIFKLCARGETRTRTFPWSAHR